MLGNVGYFGERLKSLRRRTGKTQLEVAQALKLAHPDLAISQANVSHLEKRDLVPRPDVLKILADYFGVSVDYLLSDAEDSYEDRKPKIATYLASLSNRTHAAGSFLLHTDDNKSGDKETLDTTDNLSKFYRNTDISED